MTNNSYATYLIPFHSFISLITNSSSEIFVCAGDDTAKAIEKLIDNVLRVSGSSVRSRHLFKIDCVDEIRYTNKATGKRVRELFNAEELKSELAAGVFDQEDVDDSIDENHPTSKIRVRALVPITDEVKEIISTLQDLTGLFSIDAEYNS